MREMFLYKICMDLQKENNALDQYNCLEIITVYIVGPSVLQILWTY